MSNVLGTIDDPEQRAGPKRSTPRSHDPKATDRVGGAMRQGAL
jgi:hypothetical protein